MTPFPFDSAYNTTISVAPPNLGNTLTNFAIEPSPTIQQSKMYSSNQNFVALTDNVINVDQFDRGQISNIQGFGSDISAKESFDSINLNSAKRIDIQDPELATKFYIGSITVIGLYIFYRILVKNK